MHHRILLIIILLSSSLVYSEGWAANCKIENGPPAELANYIRDTRKAAEAIDKKYETNLCGTSQTPITALNRTLSTVDKAASQTPIMNNIITDFTFNIVSLYRAKMPPMVITHGQLLYALEKNTLLPTLDRLASRCQLEGPAEGEILALLEANNHIQEYFKNVSIGSVATANGTPLEQAIQSSYSSEATQGCKNGDLDLSTAIEKMSKAVEGFGKDITEARENWDAAMSMLRGGSGNPKKSYASLQKELLQKELARQGLSQGAMQQVMTNLDCMQSATLGVDSIVEMSVARAQCVGNPLIGYGQLVSAYRDLLSGVDRLTQGTKLSFSFTDTPNNTTGDATEPSGRIPRDTDEYIQLTQKIEKAARIDKSILTTYGELSVLAGSLHDEEATTNTIITNLIGMHTSLVGVNALLEKRIPKMQANCMKGSPGVIGGCYQR